VKKLGLLSYPYCYVICFCFGITHIAVRHYLKQSGIKVTAADKQTTSVPCENVQTPRLATAYNDNHFINLLKPTGYVMHQQFNIQQLYVLPTLYLCVLYLSENKQHKLIGFYNQDEKCLLRGTNWVLK
jgi:hypothetical protein